LAESSATIAAMQWRSALSMAAVAVLGTVLVACRGGSAEVGRAAPPEEKSPKLQYDAKGNLLRPVDYRDWEFLSAGYGMNYSPAPDSHDLFTNVFVQRWAYQEFLESGKWPEHSMFVIDERDAESKGSINKKGHFQTELMGLAVEVKDSTRNPDKWAYYGFQPNANTAESEPKGNCWSCHDQHAAVEHTFVQFYPTLKPVAKKFGTYNDAREKD
jgi:cytochrome P460